MIYKASYRADHWVVYNRQTGQSLDRFSPNRKEAEKRAKKENEQLIMELGKDRYNLINKKLNQG